MRASTSSRGCGRLPVANEQAGSGQAGALRLLPGATQLRNRSRRPLCRRTKQVAAPRSSAWRAAASLSSSLRPRSPRPLDWEAPGFRAATFIGCRRTALQARRIVGGALELSSRICWAAWSLAAPCSRTRNCPRPGPWRRPSLGVSHGGQSGGAATMAQRRPSPLMSRQAGPWG